MPRAVTRKAESTDVHVCIWILNNNNLIFKANENIRRNGTCSLDQEGECRREWWQ